MIPFRTDARRPEEPPIRFAFRLLIAAYLVEAGLLLTIAPWTTFWAQNYFAHTVPWLGLWMRNSYVQGGVTGIGLVTVLTGLRDLSAVILARSAAGAPHERPPAP